jgi:hypothetical protein
MKKNTRLKKYAELFQRNISSYLAPGVSMKTVIYPVEEEGAVFEFLFNKEGLDTEEFSKLRKSVGNVLSEIPQKLIAGNIEGVQFGGTSLYLEGNRILVIKGEDAQEQWSGNAVIDDVRRVVSSSQGGRS